MRKKIILVCIVLVLGILLFGRGLLVRNVYIDVSNGGEKLYDIEQITKNDEMISEPWVADEIPEIENGYYYFEDRHLESTDKYDDSEIFERASHNYTIVVYDADARILYYCEEDT